MVEDGVKRVGAAVATLAIVRRLCHAGGGLRLVDIADPAAINRSTAYNILRTLVAEGLVSFDKSAKTYAVTAEIGRLAEAAGFGDGRAERAMRDGLERLAAEFGINAAYWVVEADRLVLKLMAESPTEVRLTLSPGQRVPLMVGAIGRAVAAASAMPAEDIARRFAATSFRRPQDLAAYLSEVQRAAALGWAEDGGSSPPGTSALAAAVRGADGTVVGACAALMMKGQFNAAERAEIGRRLAAFAESLAW